MFFWKRVEKKHYASIKEREEKYKNIVVLSDKDTKDMNIATDTTLLITEWTVVSIDYFKKLMASFVNIFGGRMKAYESLVDRARREAILKVKERAVLQNCNAIVNLRIETSSITKNAKQNVWSVEALAYASAIKM